MTISTTTNKVQYNCDGSTVAFVFSFPITAKAQIEVYLVDASATETLLTLTTDYTISAAPWTSGGTVTTVLTYASTYDLLIKRVMPLTQETDYVSNDPFPAETHEAALDKLTMITQQLEEVQDRTFKLPASSPLTDLTVPVVGHALEYFRINATEDGIETYNILNLGAYTVSDFMVTVLDDTTADAAKDTLEVGATAAAMALALGG